MEEIEERENGGTPQIIQTIRAALAFWVKEYIGYQMIEKQETYYINNALKRLMSNENMWVLGNTSVKRKAILSFLVYSTTNSSSNGIEDSERREGKEGDLYMWTERGNKRDKPLHGPFVAALLNDLFGIQSRGGCACAGPYGHVLLNINETFSLDFRSAIQQVNLYIALPCLCFIIFDLMVIKFLLMWGSSLYRFFMTRKSFVRYNRL